MRTLVPYWAKNWTAHRNAADFWQEMDRFFDGFGDGQTSYEERSFQPAADVMENENFYLVSVDLPGFKKEDIKIELNQNLLTLSGERKRWLEDDRKQKAQRFEKSYGFFKRSFTLPTTVDAEKIEAHYENGVLELHLPKTAVAQPRKIEIQSARSNGFNKQ